MKKLFALVLTLALVFAIAAPAMALSWGAEADPAGAPYGAAVKLLTPSTDAVGNSTFVDYNTTNGVVIGSTVYFSVSFTIPTTAELDAYYAGAADAGDLAVSVALKNISVDDAIVAQTKDGAAIAAGSEPFSVTAGSGKVSVAIANLTNASTTKAAVYTAIFKGLVTKTENATVTATMGYDAKDATVIKRTVGTTVYTFAAPTDATAAAGSAVIDDGKYALTLTLGANTKNIVTGWSMTTVAAGGEVYTVKAGPTFFFVGTGVEELTAADTEYAAVLAAYNGFVGILGFNPTSTGISYTDANIAANYGVAKNTSVTKTYTAYTANLTVSDSTTVPNTGDNMSVIGFVMVGLAVLATAAVVVKKVRA